MGRRPCVHLRVPLVGLAVAAMDCRSATEIRVTTYSEVDCAARARLALVLAHDAAGLAGAPIVAVSTTCAPASAPFDGEFSTGSFVVAPSAGKDAALVVQVMQRADGETPESCLDPAQAGKCIFARRQVAFSPHEDIGLPIELRLSCLGVTCSPDQTCRRGRCVSDAVPSSCPGCTEAALAPTTAPTCGPMSGFQVGASWPMAGGCPTRPGRSGVNGPRTANVRWTFTLGAIASMSPAVGADGTIYVGANDRFAHAIDPGGHEKWRAPVPSNINNSGFVVAADGTVIVGCADKNVYAFTPSGAPKWSSAVPSDVAFTPVAGADGTVFVASLDVGAAVPVVALSPTDGTQRWASAPLFGVGAVTLGVDGTLYVGGSDAKLYALRPTDGSVVWSLPTAQPPSTPSVGDDGTVYVADGQALHAVTPAGQPSWSVPIDTVADGVSIAPDGTIYVGTRSGRMHAVAPNGTLRWKLDAAAGWRLPGTVGGDGTLYQGGADGLYAISSDGRVLWKIATGIVISQPAMAGDGTLYFVTSDGLLYAVGP